MTLKEFKEFVAQYPELSIEKRIQYFAIYNGIELFSYDSADKEVRIPTNISININYTLCNFKSDLNVFDWISSTKKLKPIVDELLKSISIIDYFQKKFNEFKKEKRINEDFK